MIPWELLRKSPWTCPAGSGAKLDKTRTEFVFFKASPDESTVEVVSSFPAGTMGDGAECPRGTPSGRYGDGIIITPEYKPAAGGCRSPGA